MITIIYKNKGLFLLAEIIEEFLILDNKIKAKKFIFYLNFGS